MSKYYNLTKMFIFYKSNPSTFQLISLILPFHPSSGTTKCLDDRYQVFNIVHTHVGACAHLDLWPFGAVTHQLTWSSIRWFPLTLLFLLYPSNFSLPIHTSSLLFHWFPFPLQPYLLQVKIEIVSEREHNTSHIWIIRMIF